MPLSDVQQDVARTVRKFHDGIMDILKMLQVPGLEQYVDPWSFVILMGQMMGDAEPEDVPQMRRWSLKRWGREVSDEVERRQAQVPSVATPPKPPHLPTGDHEPEPVEPERYELPPTPKPPLPTHTGAGFDIVVPGLPPEPPDEPPFAIGGGSGGEEPPSWLTGAEADAWRQAMNRGAELVRGLGNYVIESTGKLVAESWSGEHILNDVDPAERAALMAQIRGATAEAIARGWTADRLASELGNLTGDWSRNWRRIARTELQGAYNEGVAIHAVRIMGQDARVARVPDAEACPSCRAAFLDGDGKPRIFTVRELAANGTNAGRKVTQWKPTLWPIHPHCRCDTQVVPDGFVFDDGWRLVPDEED